MILFMVQRFYTLKKLIKIFTKSLIECNTLVIATEGPKLMTGQAIFVLLLL